MDKKATPLQNLTNKRRHPTGGLHDFNNSDCAFGSPENQRLKPNGFPIVSAEKIANKPRKAVVPDGPAIFGESGPQQKSEIPEPTGRENRGARRTSRARSRPRPRPRRKIKKIVNGRI